MLKTPEAKLFDLRLAAYERTLDESSFAIIASFDHAEQSRIAVNAIPKLVYYGIKAYSFHDRTAQFDDPYERYAEMEAVIRNIGSLTPREFMGIFPIDKEFNNQKSGWRDYYSALDDAVKPNGIDRLIEEPFKLLMNYWNHDVTMFLVNMTSTMSRISQQQTGKSLIERFMDEQRGKTNDNG